MSTIAPRKLPWRQSWFVDVREHYERDSNGLRRVLWAPEDYAHARVGPGPVVGTQASIRIAGQMELTWRVRDEREGRREVERRLDEHAAAVAAKMRGTIPGDVATAHAVEAMRRG